MLIQNPISFADVRFRLLDKAEIKSVVNQVATSIEQMKARFASVPASKVLTVYSTLLGKSETNKKLKYFFFESKTFIHSRPKLSTKRLLVMGLFFDFKEWLEMDANPHT